MNVQIGTIEAVYPPNDPRNSNGYQYEYSVQLTGAGFSTIPMNHCIRSDDDGFNDDYEDKILKPSASVLVAVPDISGGMGIIIGAVRGYKSAMDSGAGNRWRNRYNKVEMLIDNSNNFSITSDSGPFMKIQTALVQIDDSAGEQIIMDKAAKTMTINANKWNVNIVGDANITVGGNLTANVKGDTNINATGNLNAQCAKAKVQAQGDVDVQSGGKATVKATQIVLNSPDGAVLTDTLNPVVDFITNVPSVGVQNVRAGMGGA